MDLKLVIAELRAELESIDHVVAAMEKLAELRSRRTTSLDSGLEQVPAVKSRSKKRAAPQERAASAGAE